MTLRLAWAAGLSAVLICLAGAAPARAGAVIDEGKFFKPETVKQAETVSHRIHDRFGKDVFVETFESIPDELKAQYSDATRAQFFENWLKQLARQRDVNGVFVLICRNPPRIQIQPGNATRLKYFTTKDRDEVVKTMATAFRSQKYDSGLLVALEFIEKRMGDNAGGDPKPAAAHRDDTTGDGEHRDPAADAVRPATQPSPATRPAHDSETPAPEPATEPALNK